MRTEPEYLDYVNGRIRAVGVTIEIARSGRDPVSLVNEAIQKKRDESRRARADNDSSNVYDAVWVMFDVDDFASVIPDAIRLAAQNNIQWAISNPCFEIWLLWHQQSHAAFVSTGDIQRRTTGARVTAGANGKAIRHEALDGKYFDARARALFADRLHREADHKFPSDNPSSNVYVLIDSILSGLSKSRPGETIVL
ncbi:RloB family protein [Rathayibacter sp. ZW T2_19]|uniref:RloB family protein n=1 Tax=Rathayibacter rubneri TaxID=2950106 RepID=A0A9X2DVA6_9MICO|nr:RloB family protein [Rathayibacter rubneri]